LSANVIGLEGRPWGIVVVPYKEEASVTLPDENFIQIINTSTMRAEQKIKVPVNCFGITLIDNDIVLGNRGEIYINNRKGERLKAIKVGKGPMYSLYCGKDNTLYCCDTSNDTLYGITQDGTILFSFSSGDLGRPVIISNFECVKTFTLSVDNVYFTSIPQYYVIVYQGYTKTFNWYHYLLFCSHCTGIYNLYKVLVR
jgi:DNA-binding beta-propeller fold protein YncE